MKEMTIHEWMQPFPRRVWYETENGYASREPTSKDILSRLDFAEKMVNQSACIGVMND